MYFLSFYRKSFLYLLCALDNYHRRYKPSVSLKTFFELSNKSSIETIPTLATVPSEYSAVILENTKTPKPQKVESKEYTIAFFVDELTCLELI